MPAKGGFGFKNINFGVFSLGHQVPETIFGLRGQGGRIISVQNAGTIKVVYVQKYFL